MQKQDLRVIKTRGIIRSALVEIMADKEIGKISVCEICALAKINRKTFYRHYRTVGDVMDELENELINDFSEHLGGSILNIAVVMRGVSEVAEKNKEFFSRLIRRNPEYFISGRMKTALCRTIAAALRSKSGEISEKTLKAAAEFIVSGVLSLFASWYREGCREDVNFITDICVKTALGGLSAFEGQRREL